MRELSDCPEAPATGSFISTSSWLLGVESYPQFADWVNNDILYNSLLNLTQSPNIPSLSLNGVSFWGSQALWNHNIINHSLHWVLPWARLLSGFFIYTTQFNPQSGSIRRVKNLPTMQETWVQSLDLEDPLEKGMATHSSISAWRIPWTEEPGVLQSMGPQRLGHNWATNKNNKWGGYHH